MIVEKEVNDLKVGMYVILPVSWLQHSFLTNSFLIESRKDIERIKKAHIKTVEIDTSKSKVVHDTARITHKEPKAPPRTTEKPALKNSEHIKNISSTLNETVNNSKTPPREKARAVYESSLELMRQLLEDPSKEAIIESKKGISSIVDMIISDEETSHCILKITQHDFYTYTHSINVGILSVSIAKKLYGNSSEHDMQELGAGFFLHDLGKTRVSPAIINKPGRLTDDEMAEMRTHPYQSYKILEETEQLSKTAAVIAMQHHEREDGTGYPRRLKGDQIHEYGRICSIADVYDALTAERSYKKAFTPFEALRIMKEEMLGHFHKDIFEKFVMLFH